MFTTLDQVTRKLPSLMLAAASAVVLTGASQAQAQEAPPVNSGKVAFSLGFDVVTEYWYRGLGQENQGLILQPWIDVTFELLSNDDLTVTGSVGTWNSIHDATAGDAWYESDFYAGFGVEMGKVSVGATYINLYNPAGGDIFVEEIDFSLSYDDSELGLPFALNPSATLAIEIDGGSDAGTNKGTYLGLSIEPSVQDILGSDSVPVGLSLPVTVGLGLDDYYEDGMGNDDTFGYIDIGLVLSTSLDGLIPADYGTWTASFGVHWLSLGDSAENISAAFGTGQDDSSVYATFGLTMEY
jgi:uncharacterized protein Gcw-chp